jgi:hypothetical protein
MVSKPPIWRQYAMIKWCSEDYTLLGRDAVGFEVLTAVVMKSSLLTFNGLHGVISQKIELSITTSVRTSNPTQCSPAKRLLTLHSTIRETTDQENPPLYPTHPPEVPVPKHHPTLPTVSAYVDMLWCWQENLQTNQQKTDLQRTPEDRTLHC